MCVCVCVCVCVYLGSSRSCKHVSLNNKDKFCMYNFVTILLIFLISYPVLSISAFPYYRFSINLQNYF